jgi:hypothetical protein
MWHDTQCPRCKTWSPHDDWYHDDVSSRLTSLEKPQSEKEKEFSALSPSGMSMPSILEKAVKGEL